MGFTILQTKINIPPVHPHLVLRTRLSEKVDSGVHDGHKLALVAAPVGFGKSIAVSIWAQNSRRKVAWLSLDSADNDEAVFWPYFITAIQKVFSDFGGHIFEMLAGAMPFPFQSILPDLANELSGLTEPLTLVLDDYHVIDNQAIHDGISFLLDHSSHTFHLVIVTRADPPLPVARLRARRGLTEIRIEDLRFTLDEARSLLNEIMALDLQEEDIGLLEKRTEGWGAGLLLAAQSMQGRSDKHEYIQKFSGSQHYILDYLMEEVINRQSEDRRNFLLQTSILERMCGSLCDALLQTEDAERTLSKLSRENLFIIPLDEEHSWYRYHHLFNDLLFNFLQKDFPKSEICELQKRAGIWYWENGEFDMAIKYVLRAADFERAAGMIEQVAGLWIAEGHVKNVLGWFDELPADLIKSRPRLSLNHAWTLSLSGQARQAEGLLLETRAALEKLPDSSENRLLRGDLAALLTGILLQTNNPSRVIQEAHEALDCLAEDNWIMRARVEVALATALSYTGETQEAIHTFEQARDDALEGKNNFLTATAIEMLAGLQIYHYGELNEAVNNLEQIIALGKTDHGKLKPFSGTAHILMAEIQLEWNRPEQAARYLETGMDLLQQGGYSHSRTHALCTQARLAMAMGDRKSAVNSMQAAGQAAQACPLMHIIIHYFACRVKMSHFFEETEKNSGWNHDEPEIFQEDIPENLPAYLQEVYQLALGRAYYDRRDYAQALLILDDILPGARSAKRTTHLIELYILRAMAYFGKEQVDRALAELEHALEWAEPQGFIRLFVEAGKPVRDLLILAEEKGVHPEYAGIVSAAFDQTPDKILDENPVSKSQSALVEPLTEREMDVFRLMCEGYSNQQIADAMVVSVNTVKKHTSNIYGKLGVRNRAQAVLSGRENRLV